MFLLFLLAALVGCPYFQAWADHAQQLCEAIVPYGPFIHWQKALVCGVPLRSPALSNFNTLGLSHLIVVSGAHLIFLENWILILFRIFRISRNSILIDLIFITYSFFAGLQPPLVRALFQKGPFRLSSLNILTSGSLSWLFFRELSLSLTLSWACALMMSWPRSKRKNPWVQSLIIYVGLFPVLLILNPPSLMAAVVNPSAAFVFGSVLFPLTVCNLVLPLDLWTNWTWEHFLMVIDAFGSIFPGQNSKGLSVSLFLYIFILQTLHLYADIHFQRKKLWT